MHTADGSIDAVRTTAGSGYTDGTYYAAINGDGSGGVVEINVSGGAIVKFGKNAGETDVVTAGTGYTFGTVDLTDVYSDSSLNTANPILVLELTVQLFQSFHQRVDMVQTQKQNLVDTS